MKKNLQESSLMFPARLLTVAAFRKHPENNSKKVYKERTDVPKIGLAEGVCPTRALPPGSHTLESAPRKSYR